MNLIVTVGGKSAFTLHNSMKEKIHPTYYPKAKVVCSCGNTFTVGSTKKEIRVELCSKCHPFYTGAQRIVDTAGRVERFKRRYRKQAEKNS
jgi:large subunit ribosomal protein L31